MSALSSPEPQEAKPMVLDVTLRDGGYVNDFHFSFEDSRSVVEALAGARIPWLEVGYFASPPELTAPVVQPSCRLDDLRALYDLVAGRAGLVVMVRPGTVAPADIARLAEVGVTLIRIALPRNGGKTKHAVQAEIECIQGCGMQVSLNVTRASEYGLSEILDFAEEMDSMRPDWLYIADSNGSLFPWQVEQLFLLLGERIQANLGFHAHDSLTLAFANSVAALEHGARAVDSSLGGMGKRGNLITELLALYLNIHGGCCFDVECLVRATERVIVPWIGTECLTRVGHAMAGILNINHDWMLERNQEARGPDPGLLRLLEELRAAPSH
jgi:4-hydroxy 2-oxovalerate aldolase